MERQKLELKTARLLAHAGVDLNGSKPWDIQIRNSQVFGRLWARGSLGFGEAYMDGWWECERLDEFFTRVFRADLARHIKTLTNLWEVAKARAFNLQNPARAFRVGEYHYDIGNDLYARMLDRRMIYSCGFWENVSNLDEAQEAKLDLVFRKLGLKPGMRVLDIGCGWGGAAKYAAERYGVSVVGITVSQEQAALARTVCAGLPIEIRLQDYRQLNEQFDSIFSIGMFEHVGYKNYRTYMQVARRCLKPDGLFLLHTIGNNETKFKGDAWMERYIFPNSMLPSLPQITKSAEDLLLVEDVHNFGAYYDPTLMAWYRNFSDAWDELKGKRYNDRFRRMWTFYLLICAAAFRSRTVQVWQILMSPQGVLGGYVCPR